MPEVPAGRDRRIGPAAPAGRAGPVSTAAGRSPAAAKARVTGSERRNGGLVKSKRGSTARNAPAHAS